MRCPVLRASCAFRQQAASVAAANVNLELRCATSKSKSGVLERAFPGVLKRTGHGNVSFFACLLGPGLISVEKSRPAAIAS